MGSTKYLDGNYFEAFEDVFVFSIGKYIYMVDIKKVMEVKSKL